MNANSAIGVFDSGLGGLSVAAEIRKQLPEETILYFGDSAHNPYGTKTKEQITKYCMEICRMFEEQDVKAIVIACNTATSACVPLLRRTFNMDIIGMEPALKVAAGLGEHQRIAVWATALTLEEEKFARLLSCFDKDHSIVQTACPRLVQLVENDQLDDLETVREVLMEYLVQSGWPDLDSVVLGCTHFVFFRQILQELAGDHVKIVDGNWGTVHHLKDLLEAQNLLSKQKGSVQILNSLPEKSSLSYQLLDRLEKEHES